MRNAHGQQEDEMKKNAWPHGERRQRNGGIEDAETFNEAQLAQGKDHVVCDVEAKIEQRGQKQEPGVEIAGKSALAKQREDPEGCRQKQDQLGNGARAPGGPTWPIKHPGKRAQHNER
jgi:hypothetical protein